MAKRIVTKVGNVFCVEIDNEYKCFFQLGSSVIRAFKTRYPMDYKPVIEDIVKDEILFYAHTILRVGIEYGAWYKVGKSQELGLDNLNNVFWGTVFQYKNHFNNGTLIITDINPLENWTIWKIYNESINVGILPEKYYDIVENGVVISYSSILERIKYGYYKGTHWMYDIIKRRPIAGVNSYTKHEIDGNECYFHYIGEDIHREMIVTSQGATRLTREEPEKNGYKLHVRVETHNKLSQAFPELNITNDVMIRHLNVQLKFYNSTTGKWIPLYIKGCNTTNYYLMLPKK